MKNLFTRLMLVAVAAMGFVACQTEPEIYFPEVDTFDMTIIADGDTRTELVGGESVQWSEGDQLSVVVNGTTYTSSALKSAATTASFTVAEVTTSETGYTIQAVYPDAANKGVSSDDPNVYKIATATEQNPSLTSFDAAADMLVAKEVTTTEQPSELSMQFTRLIALGQMTLTNFAPESAVKSVTFSTSDVALTGRSYVNLSSAEVEYGYTNQAFKNVVLNYEGTEDWTNGYTIYFTCFPAVLTSDFTVVVETEDGKKYTKSVTLDDKTLLFTAGDMTRFKVGMADATIEEPSEQITYNLLTDVNQLNAGDKIIIAAADYNYALSTTQNKNNRGQVAITKSEDKATATFGDDVQILTLEAGTTDGTFAFNTGSGYLYAASSSSNYLKTETTLSANSSWTVEFSSNNVLTIKANGSNTKNQLQYNATSSLFSCYSTNQKDVAIYYLDGEEPDYLTVSDTEISFTADGGYYTFTVSKNFEAEVSVTCDNSWFTITSNTDGSYTVSATANETTEKITGTITVTAGELTKPISLTQEAQSTGDEATKSWVRVTSTDMILSGGTFIIGYEATANSGVLVPMRSDGTNATTSADGFHLSGTGTESTSNNSTIDMSSISGTSKYEVTITASTIVEGAINIQLSDGNYIGTNNSKNTARLYTAESANTAYGLTIADNDVVTLKCAAAESYHTLQYNTTYPRFANYGGAQKNLVLYKYQ